MLFAVIVLCASVYTSCANAQPVIPSAILPGVFPLFSTKKNTTIDYNPNEVEIFTTSTTTTPEEVTTTDGDLGGSAEKNEVGSEYPWEKSGKIQGDMVLNDRQRRLIIENVEGMARNGLQDLTKRWPNNEVIYYINPKHFNVYQMQAIEIGINDLRQASCVRFRPYRNGDRDVVVINGNNPGCYSSVGYQGGQQSVNLSNKPNSGCLARGTVAHELLHTLGFFHMQSSHNRDDYVTVVWPNIIQEQIHNFDKYNAFTVTDFGVGYDYGSIMHYGPYAFSANGGQTLVPKLRGVQIGNAVGLSQKDKLKLNKMYCQGGRNNGRFNPIPPIWRGWRFW